MIVIATFLLIFFHKPQQNETHTPGFDSSQVYQTKKDSAHKVYVDSDSLRRTPISDSERAEYKRFLIRAILAGQRDSLRTD